MKPKPPACSGCEFEKRGQGYVPGIGPLNAQVAFIGQGPGEREVCSGVPFHPDAPSGRVLTSWIESAGFPRETVWLDNGSRCRIQTADGSDEAPLAAVTACFKRNWGPRLHSLPYLKAVVAVGVPAGRFLFGPWASARAAGTFNTVEF